MGAHSNYTSVESDAKTVIYLIIAFVIGVVLYFAFKFIKSLIKRHYYKQFCIEQYRINQYKQITERKERAYQRTLNNFFYNRIEEDIEEMSDVSSDKSNNLMNLYNFEVK
jgi:predicted Holliday junction resolvase-like endonuclease